MEIKAKWDEDVYLNLTGNTGVYVTQDGKQIRLLRCPGSFNVTEIINVDGVNIGIKPIKAHNNAYTHVGFFC